MNFFLTCIFNRFFIFSLCLACLELFFAFSLLVFANRSFASVLIYIFLNKKNFKLSKNKWLIWRVYMYLT